MLRIPESDWRTVAGGPQISVAYLRKLTSKAERFTQWMQRTHAKLLGAPEDVLSYCTSDLIEGIFPDVNGWLFAGDALALLTYSTNSSSNVPLINTIEHKSGIKLPVPPGGSSFAEQFSLELTACFRILWERSGCFYDLQREKWFGPYRVDFLLSEKRSAPDGSTIKRDFIIEFDEKAHRLKRYQTNDKCRDRWFRKNLPEIPLIRVRHDEQETWLEAVRRLKRIVRLEDCYGHCLRLACTDHSQPELRISSVSARNTYDMEQNECAFLLQRPAQPLREMEGLLNRLDIPYEKRRDLHFRRAKLRSYALN